MTTLKDIRTELVEFAVKVKEQATVDQSIVEAEVHNYMIGMIDRTPRFDRSRRLLNMYSKLMTLAKDLMEEVEDEVYGV